jgi:[ribosomal protein S18]-alanine N-acetyltransferase
VRVRLATADDVPAMMDLERHSPAAGHWERSQYDALFAPTNPPQRSQRFAWVVEDGGEAQSKEVSGATPVIVAFLIAHRVDAEWELENIVVAATARRSGIGKRLLGELVEHVRSTQGSEIFLEVRHSNHNARALYRKMGFEETGLRRGYYSNPTEDAILCRLRF